MNENMEKALNWTVIKAEDGKMLHSYATLEGMLTRPLIQLTTDNFVFKTIRDNLPSSRCTMKPSLFALLLV